METKAKSKFYLKPEEIIRFLEGKDDKLDTLIMCQGDNVKIYTTDQSLYEAMASMNNRKEIDLNRLVKLLEVTEILSYKRVLRKERTVLSHEKAQELLDKTNGGNENVENNRN